MSRQHSGWQKTRILVKIGTEPCKVGLRELLMGWLKNENVLTSTWIPTKDVIPSFAVIDSLIVTTDLPRRWMSRNDRTKDKWSRQLIRYMAQNWWPSFVPVHKYTLTWDPIYSQALPCGLLCKGVIDHLHNWLVGWMARLQHWRPSDRNITKYSWRKEVRRSTTKNEEERKAACQDG